MKLIATKIREDTRKIIANCCFTIPAVILCLDLILVESKAQQARYSCEFHEVKTPCDVWRNGNRISIGGFQAAPVFTLQSPWKAVDHSGFIYKVMRGEGYAFFNPADVREVTAITVYGPQL
jgi:hypothetical protein